jgi:RNA polymerase sigma-70 factor (ECF subfamily)
MTEEAIWIQQARRGETAPFANLVRTYQAPVYNLAYRMLGNRMEAEDAAQETFLKVYQNLNKYDPQRSFRTWLLSVAAHHCVDRLRRRRPTVELNEEIRLGSHANPEATVMQQDAGEHVQRMLQNLNHTDRAAVTLRYWYDCSYEEIAEVLGTTVSAVKSRLHRARRALALTLEVESDVN